jgi:hypothetical protein
MRQHKSKSIIYIYSHPHKKKKKRKYKIMNNKRGEVVSVDFDGSYDCFKRRFFIQEKEWNLGYAKIK